MPITDAPMSRRILLATAGTWGDLLPLVELGKKLVSRGHWVTVACSSGHQEWITRAGLRALSFDGDFGMESAQKNAHCWNQLNPPCEAPTPEKIRRALRKIEANSVDLARAAGDFDLLLMPSHCPEGPRVSELSNVPWMPVIFMPEDALMEQRPLPRFSTALFACSKALGNPIAPHIKQTGFWFYEDPAWAQWKPDESLRRFMQGEPPLVLTFSSLPLENPREVLEIHARAAYRLKRKLVVQQGWAGFSYEQIPDDVDPSQIYLAEFLPHDWFFSRAAGVITHGGIGTLGRALRNGCPLLIEPYGNDQFYNALLLKKLGFATVAHPNRLTPAGLATILDEKILRAPDEVRQRQTELARLIREEDGVSEACDWIENFIEQLRVAA